MIKQISTRKGLREMTKKISVRIEKAYLTICLLLWSGYSFAKPNINSNGGGVEILGNISSFLDLITDFIVILAFVSGVWLAVSSVFDFITMADEHSQKKINPWFLASKVIGAALLIIFPYYMSTIVSTVGGGGGIT